MPGAAPIRPNRVPPREPIPRRETILPASAPFHADRLAAERRCPSLFLGTRRPQNIRVGRRSDSTGSGSAPRIDSAARNAPARVPGALSGEGKRARLAAWQPGGRTSPRPAPSVRCARTCSPAARPARPVLPVGGSGARGGRPSQAGDRPSPCRPPRRRPPRRGGASRGRGGGGRPRSGVGTGFGDVRRTVLDILRDPRNRVGVAFVAAILVLLLLVVAVEYFG